jgi:hypothetical protein
MKSIIKSFLLELSDFLFSKDELVLKDKVVLLKVLLALKSLMNLIFSVWNFLISSLTGEKGV